MPALPDPSLALPRPLLPRPLRRQAGIRLGLHGLALAVTATLLQAAGSLGAGGVATALLLYLVMSGLVLAGLGDHAPHRRFGLANGVTLARAAYVALIAGLAATGGASSPTARWALAASAAAALALDGVDGWAARRAGLASHFGARFDMEVDALFILVLAALVWESGQAGIWVWASGLLRYGFVAAGWLRPRLATALPPSRRRQAVCVTQTLALILALSPRLPPAMAAAVCAAGLAALAASFAVDCARLLARSAAPAAARSAAARL